VEELWLPVPGFRFYEASSLSQLRSLDRHISLSSGGTRFVPGKVLSQNFNNYWKVKINRRTMFAHRLLGLTFLGEPEDPRHEIRHWDGNPWNNSISNLLWGTRSENERDKERHGTNWQSSKTTCLRGHRLAGENLVPSQLRRGFRECRSCMKARARLYFDSTLDFQIVADSFYLTLDMERV
jgi:hypothetical protein